MLFYSQSSKKQQGIQLMFITTFFIILLNSHQSSVYMDHHKHILDRFNSKRQGWKTSVLGSILYKNIAVAPVNRNKSFVILVWKTSISEYQKLSSSNLRGCSVSNCKFVKNRTHINAVDAIMVDLIRGFLPRARNRNPNQRWVFLTQEPPTKTFFFAKLAPALPQLANVFNWSMSYRSDSDVPIPFGRTLPLMSPIVANLTFEKLSELVPYWKIKRRRVLAAILMSCCGHRKRMEFLEQLKPHLEFEFYGKCSTVHKKTCYGKTCRRISKYFFYLAFENSRCPQYLSEKIFRNAYSNGAIPIIHGPSLDDCEKLLPPNSYIHVDNFKTVEELANKIREIGKDDKNLLSYHVWRNHFYISAEHTKSHYLCRICEALNYNDVTPSVYSEDDLRLFLDPKILCKW